MPPTAPEHGESFCNSTAARVGKVWRGGSALARSAARPDPETLKRAVRRAVQGLMGENGRFNLGKYGFHSGKYTDPHELIGLTVRVPNAAWDAELPEGDTECRIHAYIEHLEWQDGPNGAAAKAGP